MRVIVEFLPEGHAAQHKLHAALPQQHAAVPAKEPTIQPILRPQQTTRLLYHNCTLVVRLE